jgi:DNA-binding response OmpR family regulator
MQTSDSAHQSDNDRVLLVDDNLTNLQVLSQSLAGQGLTLLVARSGEEALEVAAKARPALILLDINMPGIGGFETCHRLKADPATADAVVIFLSARGDVEDKVRGLELGAADYISKPFDVDEVLARVRTHLASYRKHQELAARNRELAARASVAIDDMDLDQLQALIRAGESDRFELKSTLRWNLKANRAGKEIENSWLKTIVAFLNTDGGMLVIGVEDDGTVLGIEPDGFPNSDRYLLHANNLIRGTIGPDLTPFIKFALKPLEGKEVLVVECLPSPNPVFLKRDGDEQFFIRIGPGSRKLLASEILAYVQSREAAETETGIRPQPVTTAREATSGERILLVDDNAENLRVLHQTLDGRDYDLLVARGGEEALKIAGQALPSLVLLDIMMPPGIDGYETCRRLKSDQATRDIPVIFMSALDETKDKVHGLELGAVDYITKPFQADEVIARVDTHLTIQRLQRDLAQRNADLHAANQRMKKDLLAAAEVQQSLLPRELPTSDRARFEWTYQPCDELAGDSLGIFSLDERHIGMYVLDVTGHGVPAALLSVAITHRLSQRDPERSIVTGLDRDSGEQVIVSPSEVAGHLNRLFPMADHRFFTMVYAVIDTREGRLRYVACGHPGPLIIRADGTTETHESTGLPIGIDDKATFGEGVVELGAGDRVYLYSDAAIEEMNDGQELFGVVRLRSVLADNRSTPLRETLTSIIKAIGTWTGAKAFSDDLTLAAAEIVES